MQSDRIEAAEQRIEGQGKEQMAVPGFVFRHRLVSVADDTKMTTVTGCESQEALDA